MKYQTVQTEEIAKIKTKQNSQVEEIQAETNIHM